MKKELIGNRKFRRTMESLSRKKPKISKFLTKDWLAKKDLIQKRIQNNIAKIQKRKQERLNLINSHQI